MPVTPTDVRDKIERIIDAFEEAWLSGTKPRIEDYLKNSGEVRRDLLVELAFTDLEYRLRDGDEHVVEDLRKRFPELAADADIWRGLIAEEYRQRIRLGRNPSKDEYHTRFPNGGSQLDSALAGDPVPVATLLRTREHIVGGRLPKLSGRYRAQRIVAEGGMGYIARIVDTEFDRPLAIKVLSEKLTGVKELEERFLREARLTGQLQHPGIPPVQEKGRLEDGTPYFIMKLIKGHSLQKLLRDRASPQDRLGHFVGIFLNMCQTVAYAHSRGIIHRDLKPANIMVGAFGEVQVMDWGLAKVLRTGLSTSDAFEMLRGDGGESTIHIVHSKTTVGQQTVMGAVMGTPGYMAPEQARGETDKLDQRCDVFGLGGILCDILTGKPPFAHSAEVSGQRLSMLGDLTETFARLDRSEADSDLVALAKRCLAPEINDRPADAKAVAEAVSAYQAQVDERLKQAELEQARLVAKAQAEKARRRDRFVLGAFIGLLLIGGIYAWFWYREKLADERLQQSVAAAVQGVRQIDNAISLVDYGQGMLQQGKLDDARRTLDQARLVADDARKNLEKTRLADADAKGVDEKFKKYEERHKIAEKDLKLAQQLVRGFEGRGALKESDYDGRVKSVVVFGKAGLKIYERAFAEFGAPFNSGEPADVARKLASFPLRDALGLAFTDWMLLERSPPVIERLYAVAQAVDPDPIRSQVRRDIFQNDIADLVALSNSFSPATQPPTFSVLLSDALNGVKRYDEALRYLTRARDDIPGDFWINQMLGVFLRGLDPKQDTEAIARFESAFVLRPTAAFVTADLAQAFMFAQRFDQAEKVCKRFLEKTDAQDPRVRALLAEALAQQRQFEPAEDLLRAGLAVNPQSGFLSAQLASLYGKQGKHKEAAKLAQATLGATPDFINAVAPLGFARLNLEQFDLALEAGEHLIAWNPKTAVGYEIAGKALVRRRDKKRDLVKAADYAEQAVDREPKKPAAHQTKGEVLFAKREFRRGFLSYEAAANLMSGPLPFFNGPARELATQNMYSDASWLYAEIVKRDPADKEAWDGLISVLQVTRETAEAKKHLGDSFAQLKPDQITRFNAIPPSERQPTVSVINSREPNAQQPAPTPTSPKRFR